VVVVVLVVVVVSGGRGGTMSRHSNRCSRVIRKGLSCCPLDLAKTLCAACQAVGAASIMVGELALASEPTNVGVCGQHT
jgi:hypothetical protein